jgi:hypothetical protein
MDKQIPRNEAPSNWNAETLKEFFDSKINALNEKVDNFDRRYEEKFNAQQLGVKDALQAQDKASQKTETAQHDYNVSHNDLLRRMDEKVTMTEYKSGIKTIEDIITAKSVNDERRMDRMEADIRILRESKSGLEGKNSNLDQMAADVKTLLLARSGSEGKGTGEKEVKNNFNMVWIALIAGLSFLVSIMVLVVMIMNYTKK